MLLINKLLSRLHRIDLDSIYTSLTVFSFDLKALVDLHTAIWISIAKMAINISINKLAILLFLLFIVFLLSEVEIQYILSDTFTLLQRMKSSFLLIADHLRWRSTISILIPTILTLTLTSHNQWTLYLLIAVRSAYLQRSVDLSIDSRTQNSRRLWIMALLL